MPNGDFATRNASTGHFGYLDTSGTFSSVGASGGAPFGTFGLAPNGDVYYSDGGLLYRSASGTGVPSQVADGSAFYIGEGGTTVLPNGSVVYGGWSPGAVVIWDGTNVSNFTDVSAAITNPFAITSFANGNVLVVDGGNFTVFDPSTSEGQILSTYSSGLSSIRSIFIYEEGKCLAMSGNQLYDVDFVNQELNTVTVTGASIGSISYGVALGYDGRLYQVPTFGGTAGFFVSDPVV